MPRSNGSSGIAELFLLVLLGAGGFYLWQQYSHPAESKPTTEVWQDSLTIMKQSRLTTARARYTALVKVEQVNRTAFDIPIGKSTVFSKVPVVLTASIDFSTIEAHKTPDGSTIEVLVDAPIVDSATVDGTAIAILDERNEWISTGNNAQLLAGGLKSATQEAIRDACPETSELLTDARAQALNSFAFLKAFAPEVTVKFRPRSQTQPVCKGQA